MLKNNFKGNSVLKVTMIASIVGGLFIAACAKGDVSSTSESKVEINTVNVNKDFGPPLEFRGTISGDVLDMAPKVDGEVVTDQAKQFMATGENPYHGNSEAVKRGYTIFSTACSGCHGHLAEGKLGPALADTYWTYPKNETDKGLFETIYGGANGMMGPQQGRMTVDEILLVMAWIRYQADESSKDSSQKSH